MWSKLIFCSILVSIFSSNEFENPTKALEEVCSIAGQKLKKSQAALLYKFVTTIPANIEAAKTIIEVADSSDSAACLFEGKFNTLLVRFSVTKKEPC